MPEPRFPPILIVPIAAALAPMVSAATRRLGLSVVVIELLLGSAVGPQALGLVAPAAGVLPALATLGMAFLFFIAGLEIDLPAIRGRALGLALAGWVSGLALAVLIALGLRAAGLAQGWPGCSAAPSTDAAPAPPLFSRPPRCRSSSCSPRLRWMRG